MGKKLIVLMGPSGSGKSTARNAALALAPFTVISSDDEIISLAQQQGLTYQQSYARHHKDVNARTHQRFLDAIEAGESVVVDRTNLTPEARAVYTGPAREKGYEILFVKPDLDPHTPLGMDMIWDRSETRQDREPMPDFIVDQHIKAWISPRPEENYDDMITFSDIPTPETRHDDGMEP